MKNLLIFLFLLSASCSFAQKLTPDMWDLARITMYSESDFSKKMDSLGASKHFTSKEGELTYEFKKKGYKFFFAKKGHEVKYYITKDADNGTVFFAKLLSDLAQYYWGTKGEDGKFYPKEQEKKNKKTVYVFDYLEPGKIIYVVEQTPVKETIWVSTKME
jgi:hypothetical protein